MQTGEHASQRPEKTAHHDNHRLWKGIGGLLTALLVATVLGLIATFRAHDRELATLQANAETRDVAVDKNTKWIADWTAVLKVPERDQAQDSAIEELRRRVRALER